MFSQHGVVSVTEDTLQEDSKRNRDSRHLGNNEQNGKRSFLKKDIKRERKTETETKRYVWGINKNSY